MNSVFTHQPHRRRNALTGEWVFVSPHRTSRPWQGRVERTTARQRPAHDPQCYLCAGNRRANGEVNPPYTGTFVFRNDFAAFWEQSESVSESGLYAAQTHTGTCRVLCFSPRHDLTLADLSETELFEVIALWQRETAELGRQWRWVQLFENKGEIMGCSNPHPHGQVWAGDFVPNEPAKECVAQSRWFHERHQPLLLEYAQCEIERAERVIARNDEWVTLVPWWAVWPFETLVIPLRPFARITELTPGSCALLADMLKRLLSGYDRLFGVSFPYSMGWHGAPFDGVEHPEWIVHAHFYPPLLRSAEVKKFMVGYEMMAEAQRDLTPEAAAQRLRHAVEGTT
jgi:UDPglucose--hexose-1-phosphate uridylyltransferase